MAIREFYALVLLAVTASACGDEPRERNEDDGDCSYRTGTYSLTYAERSGTCGPIPEQIATIDEQPSEPPAPCTGTVDYSDDNCEVTTEFVCPEDGLGAGWTSHAEAKIDWNESGSRGEGVAQFVLLDESGGIVCQSTYDMVSTRL